MPVTHEPWLVALSVVVAIQGAYVGLSLAVQVGGAVGLRRRLLLAGAATSLAVAIWAMHFVGMLAARLPFPVDYLVFPTLLSFLVCVIVVGGAVFAASSGPLTPVRLVAAACGMGTGIFTMHYLGMMALHASAAMVHAPALVAASLAVAIGASGLALWLAGGRAGPPLLMSAVAFGIAVSGMHYTAMAGLTLFPHDHSGAGAPALSSDLLAIVVAIVAFLVSAVFLLFLVPDRAGATADPIGNAANPPAVEPAIEPAIAPAIAPAGAAPALPATPDGAPNAAAAPLNAGAELGRGSFGPLGGAGAPARRLARHLPVERDGATHFVAVDAVVAVHANAHYTYIFDGTAKLFCPLAIGDVEARLDKNRFVRVHRSHIVNVERIVGLKRAGDSGLVELAATDRYSVPVSRSRVGWLKSRIGEKNGEGGSDAAASSG